MMSLDRKIAVAILHLLFMKKRNKPYNSFQLGSAVFMILALFWLTISTPFVYASELKLFGSNQMTNTQSSPIDANEEDCANPFGNTTEEKNPNSNNTFSEEYLHELHLHDHFFFTVSQNYSSENADTYIAFHGELLVPPPDVA